MHVSSIDNVTPDKTILILTAIVLFLSWCKYFTAAILNTTTAANYSYCSELH